ncbi:hypothetical protein NDI76_19045 [Halogeometricum sp. S1BR25-6]|uniref:Uncharacterized protein n=1 Tax=Halogeometricum salsisoli TaxID=2950536 RepID=A0ABU2GJ67_9EURY|nr:hypothetical protein [Halogeometricum sp. S1BR25-6]MDS0300850.1 hypothetical protein [Halogeometricum sp. S1BR25-6]
MRSGSADVFDESAVASTKPGLRPTYRPDVVTVSLLREKQSLARRPSTQIINWMSASARLIRAAARPAPSPAFLSFRTLRRRSVSQRASPSPLPAHDDGGYYRVYSPTESSDAADGTRHLLDD